MNKEELIDWIDRQPSNHDLDNINYIIGIFKQNEQLKEQLQDIHSEFAKYDWKGATKEQIVNQIKSLYNAIYKESDVK